MKTVNRLEVFKRVLANLQNCDHSLVAVQQMIAENQKLLETTKRVTSPLDTEETKIAEQISAQYQQIIAWADEEKLETSRQLGKLSDASRIAKSYVDDSAMQSRFTLYY